MSLVPVHGGLDVPVNRVLKLSRRKSFLAEAAGMPKIAVTEADLATLFAALDPAEPFPAHALRTSRAKGGRVQRVALPAGYLDERDDDTPPRGPTSPAELEAWEKALQSG